MWWFVAGAIFWVICGVLAYGMAFAQCQGMLPRPLAEDIAADRRVALCAALCGPIALVFALHIGGVKYGLKFRTSERTERCEE